LSIAPKAPRPKFASPVAVAIPVYRSTLLLSEEFSLRQCSSVLEQYPIFFVAPASLDLAPYHAIFPHGIPLRFGDRCFKGVRAYNRLMCSSAFYEKFADYEFVLIYQLDAMVFRDELLSWCSLDFDYIGAPWPNGRETKVSLIPGAVRMAKATGYRVFNPCVQAIVGNGGLSLRRISAFLFELRRHWIRARAWRCDLPGFFGPAIT
jgi:hypothetical protein